MVNIYVDGIAYAVDSDHFNEWTDLWIRIQYGGVLGPFSEHMRSAYVRYALTLGESTCRQHKSPDIIVEWRT